MNSNPSQGEQVLESNHFSKPSMLSNKENQISHTPSELSKRKSPMTNVILNSRDGAGAGSPTKESFRSSKIDRTN